MIKSLTHEEAISWLESCQCVKLEVYDHPGNLLRFAGWRYWVKATSYGATMVDEKANTCHIMTQNVKQWGRKDSQVWAVYAECVLLYSKES